MVYNIPSISTILDKKSYIVIAKSLLEHIIFSDNLTPQERLFYLLCDFLANIELNSPKRSGKRQIRMSVNALSSMLNISSRTVLRFQKSLQNKGYLLVEKGGVDKYNRQQRNLLTPILPKSVYKKLNREPNRNQISNLEIKDTSWQERDKLDKEKLFVKINFKMARAVIASNKINSTAKLLWFYCYIRSYVSHQQANNLFFHDTVMEISKKSAFSSNAIRKAIQQLSNNQFITVEEYKVDNKFSYRKERRVLTITTLLPAELLAELMQQPDRRHNFSQLATVFPDKKSSVPIEPAANPATTVTVPQDHHQTQTDHHQNLFGSPLCIKNLNNKKSDNKNVGDMAIPKKNPPATNTPEIDNNVVIENDKQNKQQVENIIQEFKVFQEKSTKANLDEEQQLQIYSQRLSVKEKNLLTAAANKVNLRIEAMLYSREAQQKQGIAVPKQSFNEFLAILKPFEKLLYVEFNKEFSWLLNKPQNENILNFAQPKAKLNDKDFIQDLEQQSYDKFSNNEIQHIKNYLTKLHRNEDIKGEAQQKTLSRLITEVILFMLNWQPKKSFTTSRDKRCFLLTTVGNKMRAGLWQTPATYLIAERQQIEFNLHREKLEFA